MGRKWPPEDDELFRKLYPYFSDQYLMKRFNRSEGSIKARGAGLGLQKKENGKPVQKQHLEKKYSKGDKRRTHSQSGVLGRIIENQQRGGFKIRVRG